MFEFLRRLFAPEPRSSDTARERLRLVLLSDHLSLAPDVVEALKRDLLAVISQYLEIDPAHADVTFEQGEREVAMLASIPITGVRDRSGVPPHAAAAAVAVAAPEPPALEQLVLAPETEAEPELEPQAYAIPTDTEAAVPDEGSVRLQAMTPETARRRPRASRPSADFGSA